MPLSERACVCNEIRGGSGRVDVDGVAPDTVIGTAREVVVICCISLTGEDSVAEALETPTIVSSAHDC